MFYWGLVVPNPTRVSCIWPAVSPGHMCFHTHNSMNYHLIAGRHCEFHYLQDWSKNNWLVFNPPHNWSCQSLSRPCTFASEPWITWEKKKKEICSRCSSTRPVLIFKGIKLNSEFSFFFFLLMLLLLWSHVSRFDVAAVLPRPRKRRLGVFTRTIVFA